MHPSILKWRKIPGFRELAVYREGSDEYSAYYRVPRNSQELLSRSKLIEAGTAEGATLVLLIKEIGTDALFALKTRPWTQRRRARDSARRGILPPLPRQ